MLDGFCLHRSSVLSHVTEAKVPGSERSVASVYLGLRNLALQNPPAKIQGASIANPGEPFAVLMDWGIPAGTATVAAYADGRGGR